MPRLLYSLDDLQKLIIKLKPTSVCVVTSKKLAAKLSWSVKEINHPHIKMLFVPDGEAAKEWSETEKVLGRFASHGMDKKSLVIALGGGTIGDLVGFAAAIYLRGIACIQVPTTLLAQVDSSHGGKNGINFNGLKNQIGTIVEPYATVIDTRFLLSLSKEQIVDGLGEIIKAGLIKDPQILVLLNKENENSLIQSRHLKTIIQRAINVKYSYTKKDMYDNGQRQILNFGHTIGHAIELQYKISHGKAVIVGMLKELEIAETLGFTPRDIRKKYITLLDRYTIKTDTYTKVDWMRVLHDKKIQGKYIYLPILEKVGLCRLMKMPLNVLKKNLL